MKNLILEEGKDKYKIKGIINFCGKDVNVAIIGGEKEHIGAVALAQPRKSLSDETKISATTSVICAMGHKEDELAKLVAESLAKQFNCIVSASVGIHIDNVTKDDIDKININFNRLID
ncbi:MAG: hypothetical protein ACRCTZ_04320 [Sarcina sp.]